MNPIVRLNVASRGLLLLSTEERRNDSMDSSPAALQFNRSGQWEALEHHLVITSPVLSSASISPVICYATANRMIFLFKIERNLAFLNNLSCQKVS